MLQERKTKKLKGGKPAIEADTISQLKSCWQSLDPPVPENEVIGRWYALVYGRKGQESVFVGKVIRRFLTDETSGGGRVDEIEVDCLKSCVGTKTVMNDYPAGATRDIFTCPITDVIAGPLVVERCGTADKFDVPKLNEIKFFMTVIRDLDRTALRDI